MPPSAPIRASVPPVPLSDAVPTWDWATALADLRRGDTATIKRLERLIAHCLASLGPTAPANGWEDISQDVLLALLRRPKDCETRFVAAYVRATTFHIYLDYVRRERGRRGPDGRREGTSAWRRQVSLDEVGARCCQEARGRCLVDEGIADALARLDERRRQAVTCKYLLGQSNEEAACILGESLSGYRRLVASGVEELRRQIVHVSDGPGLS
jgi:DNA-directed RNA polymerase specialized sigma24 family protein